MSLPQQLTLEKGEGHFNGNNNQGRGLGKCAHASALAQKTCVHGKKKNQSGVEGGLSKAMNNIG